MVAAARSPARMPTAVRSVTAACASARATVMSDFTEHYENHQPVPLREVFDVDAVMASSLGKGRRGELDGDNREPEHPIRHAVYPSGGEDESGTDQVAAEQSQDWPQGIQAGEYDEADGMDDVHSQMAPPRPAKAMPSAPKASAR